MIKIEQVQLKDITEEDVKWLERGCLGAWDKTSVKNQVEAIRQHAAWLFRISGDAKGVFVLAIQNRDEKILCMTAMAGQDILRHFAEIYEQIIGICKRSDTKTLVGWVHRPGLQKVYREHTKGKAVAVAFAEEI